MSESIPEGAETLAVPTGDDRALYEDGCPECDQPPADDVETLSTLFDLYSAAEDEGNARCRACQTVFDVATGEVVSSA